MTERTFRPYDRDQMLLLPPSLKEWLPEGHLSGFVSDVVDALDLSEIFSYYGGPARGTKRRSGRPPLREERTAAAAVLTLPPGKGRAAPQGPFPQIITSRRSS